MKARVLSQLLGNPGYIVADYDEYFAVGSPLCHDLIKVMKGTFKMTHALSINYSDHRPELINNPVLLAIWDKLKELIESGEINYILEGNDVIENPLPVYTVEGGVLICTTTDAYGWPNTTVEGKLMHDNDYFKTARAALKYGIRQEKAYIKILRERVAEIKKDLSEKKAKLTRRKANLKALQSLLPGHPSEKGSKTRKQTTNDPTN